MASEQREESLVPRNHDIFILDDIPKPNFVAVSEILHMPKPKIGRESQGFQYTIVSQGTTKRFDTLLRHVLVATQTKILQDRVGLQHLCKSNSTNITNTIILQMKQCQRFVVVLEHTRNRKSSFIFDLVARKIQFLEDLIPCECISQRRSSLTSNTTYLKFQRLQERVSTKSIRNGHCSFVANVVEAQTQLFDGFVALSKCICKLRCTSASNCIAAY
eukprot:CAMPEP_0116842776 /NCGR_PEP_ID=MMETSP0418-20121206/11707_1 /TAXON_ID=1158023 /ORGANISM="Astrosyne radiata, Strain 13vi08-1A" /LENGTH=216 /DNA_ID=CAMNT_0004473429 /DNA_START=154 /DNA_END=801 /DNA_ORIENTATION=+